MKKPYVGDCKFCAKPIHSFNKHRKSCYECKKDKPHTGSEKGGEPFIRKLLGVFK